MVKVVKVEEVRIPANGCVLHPSCFECPLPECGYKESFRALENKY